MSFRTMAQPNRETFTIEVKPTEKQKRKANIGVAIVFTATTVFAIIVQYVA